LASGLSVHVHLATGTSLGSGVALPPLVFVAFPFAAFVFLADSDGALDLLAGVALV